MIRGRITAVKHFEIHDGDGIRTTVFFKGCPLRCRWCHNPETIQPKLEPLLYQDRCIGCSTCANLCGCHSLVEGIHRFDRDPCTGCNACVENCPTKALVSGGKWVTARELLPELLEDSMFYQASGGGVTLSGGEPLFQPEFAAQLLRLLKEAGVSTAVDTSCFAPPAALEGLLADTDLFLVDIKAMDEQVHRRCTGVSNGAILENIRLLDSMGKTMDLRVPVIPGWNDDQMEKIADFAATLRCARSVKLLPYHDYGQAKASALDQKTEPISVPTQPQMRHWHEVFLERGLTLAR